MGEFYIMNLFHFFRSTKLRANEEQDQSEWNSSMLTMETKCVDPPHVNSMKRAEVVSIDGR